MAEAGLQVTMVRGKPKSRYRKLDALRGLLRHVKTGDKEATKNGLTPELRLVLQERLLANRVPKDRSPLVLASQHNQREMLHYLHENFELNLEQETSTVIEGGHPVEGATPLWTAATLGFMDIVKDLVHWGASIEHTTDSRSSPLRGAAFDGHLNVVEFLVGKGANIDKPNQVGQSPLTIAAAMQKTATVDFLLKSGANIHHRGHNGDTPLHVAVESGSGEVTKILVKAGARNVPNDIGYTPAILACCYGHHKIMEFLHSKFSLGAKERYNCFCLLVAKDVLNGKTSDAISWANKAIDIRKKHKEIDKYLATSPAHSVYDGIQEPSREDVARHILTDDVLSFFLCSIYCERILGTIHPTTAFYIRISGDMALEDRRYKKCMQLWLRSLEFDQAARMAYELQITEDLLFCVRGFAIMLREQFLPEIRQHFQWGIKEFKLAKDSKISEVDVCCCLCRILAVWFMVVDAVPDPRDKQTEKEKLVSAAHQLCFLMKGCSCPLLLACLRNTPENNSQLLSAATSVAICNLPLHLVVELLIELGCSVNCEDSKGNYPLHLAVTLREDSALKCVQTLIENGAHVDAVNHFKQTPLDLAKTRCGFPDLKNDLILCLSRAMREHCSLQCLAARALITQEQNYIKMLPLFLVSFVAQHEPDEQEDTEEDCKNEEKGSRDFSLPLALMRQDSLQLPND